MGCTTSPTYTAVRVGVGHHFSDPPLRQSPSPPKRRYVIRELYSYISIYWTVEGLPYPVFSL